MLTCLLNGRQINSFDNSYEEKQLRKWAKKGILKCPACDKPYEYCHGKIRSPYFRHKDKIQCEDKYSEPETEEHLSGKRDLYEWLKIQPGVTDCILEGWLSETKQRPDILFKYNNQQCVIEYQCSPISTEYYERHKLYQAAGIKDIWICGINKYFQYYHTGNGTKKVNELEQACGVYYDSKNKNIYLIDKDMIEKDFQKIKKNKNGSYIMRNPFDYRVCNCNYYFVKDSIVSYYSYSYYPSGRPSNKYPYPITRYKFSRNVSLAKCMPLKSLKLKSIN